MSEKKYDFCRLWISIVDKKKELLNSINKNNILEILGIKDYGMKDELSKNVLKIVKIKNKKGLYVILSFGEKFFASLALVGILKTKKKKSQFNIEFANFYDESRRVSKGKSESETGNFYVEGYESEDINKSSTNLDNGTIHSDHKAKNYVPLNIKQTIDEKKGVDTNHKNQSQEIKDQNENMNNKTNEIGTKSVEKINNNIIDEFKCYKKDNPAHFICSIYDKEKFIAKRVKKNTIKCHNCLNDIELMSTHKEIPCHKCITEDKFYGCLTLEYKCNNCNEEVTLGDTETRDRICGIIKLKEGYSIDFSISNYFKGSQNDFETDFFIKNISYTNETRCIPESLKEIKYKNESINVEFKEPSKKLRGNIRPIVWACNGRKDPLKSDDFKRKWPVIFLLSDPLNCRNFILNPDGSKICKTFNNFFRRLEEINNIDNFLDDILITDVFPYVGNSSSIGSMFIEDDIGVMKSHLSQLFSLSPDLIVLLGDISRLSFGSMLTQYSNIQIEDKTDDIGIPCLLVTKNNKKTFIIAGLHPSRYNIDEISVKRRSKIIEAYFQNNWDLLLEDNENIYKHEKKPYNNNNNNNNNDKEAKKKKTQRIDIYQIYKKHRGQIDQIDLVDKLKKLSICDESPRVIDTNEHVEEQPIDEKEPVEKEKPIEEKQPIEETSTSYQTRKNNNDNVSNVSKEDDDTEFGSFVSKYLEKDLSNNFEDLNNKKNDLKKILDKLEYMHKTISEVEHRIKYRGCVSKEIQMELVKIKFNRIESHPNLSNLLEDINLYLATIKKEIKRYDTTDGYQKLNNIFVRLSFLVGFAYGYIERLLRPSNEDSENNNNFKFSKEEYYGIIKKLFKDFDRNKKGCLSSDGKIAVKDVIGEISETLKLNQIRLERENINEKEAEVLLDKTCFEVGRLGGQYRLYHDYKNYKLSPTHLNLDGHDS